MRLESNEPGDPGQELEELINRLAGDGADQIETLFGPLREMGIPSEEIENLKARAISLSGQELAQAVYELRQKYPPIDTGDLGSFAGWKPKNPENDE